MCDCSSACDNCSCLCHLAASAVSSRISVVRCSLAEFAVLYRQRGQPMLHLRLLLLLLRRLLAMNCCHLSVRMPALRCRRSPSATLLQLALTRRRSRCSRIYCRSSSGLSSICSNCISKSTFFHRSSKPRPRMQMRTVAQHRLHSPRLSPTPC